MARKRSKAKRSSRRRRRSTSSKVRTVVRYVKMARKRRSSKKSSSRRRRSRRRSPAMGFGGSRSGLMKYVPPKPLITAAAGAAALVGVAKLAPKIPGKWFQQDEIGQLAATGVAAAALYTVARKVMPASSQAVAGAAMGALGLSIVGYLNKKRVATYGAGGNSAGPPAGAAGWDVSEPDESSLGEYDDAMDDDDVVEDGVGSMYE